MEIRKFGFLHDDARRLREKVFVDEQKFEVEFDETDDAASHLVMYDGETAVAVCRYFYSAEKGCYMIGRVAVAKEYRGRSLGSRIMRAAEEYIRAEGGREVALSSQCRASHFYETLGYKKTDDEYFEEYCPHVLMRKQLAQSE